MGKLIAKGVAQVGVDGKEEGECDVICNAGLAGRGTFAAQGTVGAEEGRRRAV